MYFSTENLTYYFFDALLMFYYNTGQLQIHLGHIFSLFLQEIAELGGDRAWPQYIYLIFSDFKKKTSI